MIRPYVAVIALLASLADRRENGQGLAEYALAAAVVAALAATVLAFLGDALQALDRAMEIMLNA